MAVQVRKLSKADFPACKALWTERFHDTAPFLDFFFENRFCPALSFGCFEDNNLVSAAYGRPYSLRIESIVRTGVYIAGVATTKSREGHGYMRLVMEALEREAKEQDYPFLLLSPAEEAIYLSLGFQTILRYKKLPGESSEILSEKPDASEMLSCYLRAGLLDTIYPERTLEDMKLKILEQQSLGSSFVFSHHKNGDLSGYAIISADAVEEFVFTSPASKTELLKKIPSSLFARVQCRRKSSPSQSMIKPLSKQFVLPSSGSFFIQDCY